VIDAQVRASGTYSFAEHLALIMLRNHKKDMQLLKDKGDMPLPLTEAGAVPVTKI
jgi:hypothetical protein